MEQADFPFPRSFPREAWAGLRRALLLTRFALIPAIVLTLYEVLGVIYDADWAAGEALAADPAAFEALLESWLLYWLVALGPVYAVLHVCLGTTTDRLRRYPQRRGIEHVFHALAALTPLLGAFLTLGSWRDHADEVEDITGRKGLGRRVHAISLVVPCLFGIGLWVFVILGIFAGHKLGLAVGRAVLAAGLSFACAGPFVFRLWVVEQLRQAMEAAETNPHASRAAGVEPTAG